MRTEAERRIAHLHRRAGFGLSREGLAAAGKKGFEACVEELLHPERVEDPLDRSLPELQGELFDLTNLEDAQAWWIYRMVRTTRPLREKMTLFWHGHFATGASKVDGPATMVRQNETLRAHALGRFRVLLGEVAKDPAMLLWLDGARSTKKSPNENFARELLELFTLGIGHYGEADVRSLARVFTGWKVRDGEAVYDPKDHDGTPKTLFGETRPWKAEEALDRLASHEASAARLAAKLVRFFVADEGLPALEAELARAFLEHDGEMRPTLRALFLSPHFVSDGAFRAKVRSPAEFVVGAIRELGAPLPVKRLAGPMARMGQALFNPPTVKGWDGGLEWINTATLFERANFANFLVTHRPRRGDPGFDPAAWVPKATDGPALVAVFLDALLDGDAPEPMRAALEDYLKSPGEKGMTLPFRATKAAIDEKVRGLARLVVSSPEYQLA